MTTFHPYLNFAGNTEEAFEFYKSVFGGEFLMIMRFKEVPTDSEHQLSEEEGEKIMHIALPINENTMLMGTDILESMKQKRLVMGTNQYINISPDSREEADRVFNALSKGGVVEVPLQDMFWGDYYGSFTDQFGIQWMINYRANSND